MTALPGKKTYLVVAAAALVLVAYALHWIDEQTADMLLAALGFGGLAALRAGIHKAAPPDSPEGQQRRS